MIPSHTLKMNARNKGITTGVHLNWTSFWMCTEYQDSGGTGWKSYTTENKHTLREHLQNYIIHLDRATLSICAYSKGQRRNPVGLGIRLKTNQGKLFGRVFPFHSTLAQFLSVILDITNPLPRQSGLDAALLAYYLTLTVLLLPQEEYIEKEPLLFSLVGLRSFP